MVSLYRSGMGFISAGFISSSPRVIYPQVKFLLEISVVLTFMSTGLVYNFLYDPEKKLATTDYYLLHQFIFSAVLMMFEVFCSSIPIRFYHVVYCWPVVGLYSGLLYWHNQGTD